MSDKNNEVEAAPPLKITQEQQRESFLQRIRERVQHFYDAPTQEDPASEGRRAFLKWSLLFSLAMTGLAEVVVLGSEKLNEERRRNEPQDGGGEFFNKITSVFPFKQPSFAAVVLSRHSSSSSSQHAIYFSKRGFIGQFPNATEYQQAQYSISITDLDSPHFQTEIQGPKIAVSLPEAISFLNDEVKKEWQNPELPQSRLDEFRLEIDHYSLSDFIHLHPEIGRTYSQFMILTKGTCLEALRNQLTDLSSGTDSLEENRIILENYAQVLEFSIEGPSVTVTFPLENMDIPSFSWVNSAWYSSDREFSLEWSNSNNALVMGGLPQEYFSAEKMTELNRLWQIVRTKTEEALRAVIQEKFGFGNAEGNQKV